MKATKLFWFSVEDILPEADDGLVMVRLESVHGHSGYHHGADRYVPMGMWGRWENAYDSGFKVTHWAHLWEKEDEAIV